MVYASPIGAEFASGSFYDRQSFYLFPDKLESDYSAVRFARELRIFRKFCRSGVVLDVGCSTGAFLWQLRERFPENYDVFGTDVAGKALDFAQEKGILILREAFLDMGETFHKFDAICFWAVLEHLAKPDAFLKKAEALLKPGGHCFILVPNLRSLAIRLLGSRYRYIMPDHLNYFERATLLRLLEKTPILEPIACGTSHFNPAVIWTDWRRPTHRRVPDEERASLLRKTTTLKESSWLRPLRPIYKALEAALSFGGLSDNLWMVVRKN
jgi:SAM-dependent methyltransferase